MLASKKAFTMLEMILVLMIISVILGITLISIKSFNTNNTLNQVAKTVASRYELTRSLAEANHTNCYLSLNDNTIKVECDDVVKSEWALPKGVTITTNYSKNTIKMNKNGHIARAGTITINYKDGSKKVKIGIGKGDIHIE